MKPLQCPWRLSAKLCFIPFGVFLLLTVGALFFQFVLGWEALHMAVYANFIIQGSVWGGIGFVFYVITKQKDHKLTRLKYDGDFYQGTIESTTPIFGVRLMHYITFRADCSYINHEQKKCLVRSPAFIATMPHATMPWRYLNTITTSTQIMTTGNNNV